MCVDAGATRNLLEDRNELSHNSAPGIASIVTYTSSPACLNHHKQLCSIIVIITRAGIHVQKTNLAAFPASGLLRSFLCSYSILFLLPFCIDAPGSDTPGRMRQRLTWKNCLYLD